ncbi:MAG: L,D-transpeptidase family protein [Bryobacteraceae bacterium]
MREDRWRYYAVGPKIRKGEGKTPEGAYFISGKNAASAYHRSLRVSYPNAADRKRAKRQGVDPGDDIMIHGLPNGQGFIGAAHRLIDWTDGCSAVRADYFFRIQMSHVRGPASSSVMAQPANLRISLIWPWW